MEAADEVDCSRGGGSPLEARDRGGYWRNISGFWLLGLCNNFAYVIMLSAAHDILSTQEGGNRTIPSPEPNDTIGAESLGPVTRIGGESNGTGRYDCNPISTATILLADILPTLAIKLTAPFFNHLTPYGVRVLFCALTALSSFLIVSFSVGTWMSILGVVFASSSSGLGEYTFLSLTSFFHVDVIAGWSSGTGAAGLLGSLSYSGLTQGGLSPRHTLQVMVLIPIIMWASYFCVLVRPLTISNWRVQYTHKSPEHQPIIELENTELTESKLTVHRKMLIIRGLLKFMIPLGLVYFAEYFINQGLVSRNDV